MVALVLLLALLASSLPADAQSLHPNVVMFQPSVDHDAVAGNGQPFVRRYELEISRVGALEPLLTLNLGKPAIDDDGYIRVVVEHQINVQALAGRTLEARIAAVGPSGTSRGPVSNVFSVDACRYVVPGSIEVDGSGGEIDTSVRVSGDCSWHVDAVGFPVAHAGTVTGSAPIRVSVAPNPSNMARVGAVSVGSQLILVFQKPGR